MGHIVHHALVVTSHSERAIEEARLQARRIGCAVTPVVLSGTNGYSSFLVGPDGSKSGWGESEAGDDRREEFVAWLRERRDKEDDSSPFEWCEVEYGSDDRTAKVKRHEWSSRGGTR